MPKNNRGKSYGKGNGQKANNGKKKPMKKNGVQESREKSAENKENSSDEKRNSDVEVEIIQKDDCVDQSTSKRSMRSLGSSSLNNDANQFDAQKKAASYKEVSVSLKDQLKILQEENEKLKADNAKHLETITKRNNSIKDLHNKVKTLDTKYNQAVELYEKERDRPCVNCQVREAALTAGNPVVWQNQPQPQRFNQQEQPAWQQQGPFPNNRNFQNWQPSFYQRGVRRGGRNFRGGRGRGNVQSWYQPY